MSEINFEVPKNFIIANVGTEQDKFVPYKQNFNFPLEVNDLIKFKIKKSNPFIYYTKQATKNLVAKEDLLPINMNIEVGKFETLAKPFVAGASYNAIADSFEFTSVENKEAKIVYNVYGEIPYAAKDTTIGQDAGNIFTVKLTNDKVTAKNDLPSGNIATVTVEGDAARNYKKDNFEADGSLVATVKVTEGKKLTIAVKWQADAEGVEITTQTYEFNFDNCKFLAEGEVAKDVKSIDIDVPTDITIKNNGEFKVGFTVYQENLTQYIAAGDSLTLTCATAEEAMYYLMQANENLTVEL